MNFCSLIVQLVEHRTVNPYVPGSSPGRGAISLEQLPVVQLDRTTDF